MLKQVHSLSFQNIVYIQQNGKLGIQFSNKNGYVLFLTT